MSLLKSWMIYQRMERPLPLKLSSTRSDQMSWLIMTKHSFCQLTMWTPILFSVSLQHEKTIWSCYRMSFQSNHPLQKKVLMDFMSMTTCQSWSNKRSLMTNHTTALTTSQTTTSAEHLWKQHCQNQSFLLFSCPWWLKQKASSLKSSLPIWKHWNILQIV